jgi:hypothetical protein
MPQQDRLSDDRFSQKDSISGAPVVAVAALSSSSDQTPPFGGILKIPKEAVGPMRCCTLPNFTRFGNPHRVRGGHCEDRAGSALQTIDFETDKPLQLGRTGLSSAFGHVDSMGKVLNPRRRRVRRRVVRPLASPASGTTYQSSTRRHQGRAVECCRRRQQTILTVLIAASRHRSTSM